LEDGQFLRTVRKPSFSQALKWDPKKKSDLPVFIVTLRIKAMRLSQKSNFKADILDNLKIKKEKQLIWKKSPLLFFNLYESRKLRSDS